jgi:hypothetical protein
MSAFIKALSSGRGNEEELGGQMSFLEHLDELRRRLVRSFVFIIIAGTVSFFFSDEIYSFLAAPVQRALAEAQRRQVPIAGYSGNETIAAMTSLKENDIGRYVFGEETKLGTSLIPAGASVMARVLKDGQGKLGLFTDEALYSGNAVIPKGVRLPIELGTAIEAFSGVNDKLIVTTAMEPFSLYLKVSLYAAICHSCCFKFGGLSLPVCIHTSGRTSRRSSGCQLFRLCSARRSPTTSFSRRPPGTCSAWAATFGCY